MGCQGRVFATRCRSSTVRRRPRGASAASNAVLWAFELPEAPTLATLTTHRLRKSDQSPTGCYRNIEFLRLWGGQTVSSVGSGIVKLAAPLLVLALTESPTMAGLVGGALTFPMIFLGLPAGALVDRWDRRKVMIVCDTVRCLAVTDRPGRLGARTC